MARDRSLLDPDVLRDLLAHLAATDIDELELAQGRSRLYLRREPGRGAAIEPPEGPRAREEGLAVRAPLAGVLYTRPSPEQPPFVAVGDPVEPGQVIALIETMKLFNEVIAEAGGEVISLAADEGDLVEAGQPLLYLRPRDGGEG